MGRTMPRRSRSAGLGGVGMRHAAQANLAVRCGRQDDVVRLDARKLLEDGSGRVSKACALLPRLFQNTKARKHTRI